MTPLRLSLPLALLLVSACTGAPATPSPTASPSLAPGVMAVDVEGCEHLQEGPAQAVEANAPSMSRMPASVRPGHSRWDVSLPAENGARQGVLTLESDEVGDVAIFLDKDVPLTLRKLGSAAGPVPFETIVKSVSQCDTVKARYVAELEVGSYFLELGPTDQSAVSLVIEHVEAGDAHP